MKTKNEILSSLWLFVLLNYLYCDIIGLMDSSLLKQYLSGTVNGMTITQSFLVAGAILMEIPMAMILVSKFAPQKWNKWSNIIAAIIMTLVQTATLFATTPTVYYLIFSIIEIGVTISILAISIKVNPKTVN